MIPDTPHQRCPNTHVPEISKGHYLTPLKFSRARYQQTTQKHKRPTWGGATGSQTTNQTTTQFSFSLSHSHSLAGLLPKNKRASRLPWQDSHAPLAGLCLIAGISVLLDVLEYVLDHAGPQLQPCSARWHGIRTGPVRTQVASRTANSLECLDAASPLFLQC